MIRRTDSMKMAYCIALSACIAVIVPFVGMHWIDPFSIFENKIQRQILFSIRVPRVMAGFLAGGGLSLCGMVLQAMFRNPLAEPFTLGISSGASCGAALAIVTGMASIFPVIPTTTIGALLGAAAAIALVYAFSRINRYADTHAMLLSGIVVSFLFSSVMMLVQYMSDIRDSFSIVRWLMGGLETYGYTQIAIMLCFILAGLGIIFFKIPEIDHLLAGDELAHSRGVNVAKTKLLLLMAVTLIAGGIVASCGPIGFIGLIIPYIVRAMFILNHRILAPVTFTLGGAFLILCDTAARTVIAPVEIPVGVITSLVGAPFFLWLLFSKKKHIQRGMF